MQRCKNFDKDLKQVMKKDEHQRIPPSSYYKTEIITQNYPAKKAQKLSSLKDGNTYFKNILLGFQKRHDGGYLDSRGKRERGWDLKEGIEQKKNSLNLKLC